MKETPSQLQVPSFVVNFPFTLDTKNPNNIWMQELKPEELQVNRPRAYRQFMDLYNFMAGASLTYVGSKVRSCEQIGFESTLVSLPEDITEEALLSKIDELNNDDNLDGFIVQLPLPKHINEEKILLAINPDKDVDGFHPTNFGRMALEMETFLPATPFGIMELLERYKVETAGKHTVVIGRSHIVGRPMSILMSRKGYPGDSTVTLTHSRTKKRCVCGCP